MNNSKQQTIKDWAEDDRPREKLKSKGADVLSDSELIAIIIRSGTREKSAVAIAKELLLLGKNNLKELQKLSIKKLMTIKGIGATKAISIAAALELGRRCQDTDVLSKLPVNNSQEVANYLHSKFPVIHEAFGILYLNRANKVIHFEILSYGGLTDTVVDPRVIMKRAIEHEAISIIICHNHPSGSLNPSQQDIKITRQINAAAMLLDIKLVDHIILGETGYYSFADEGLIN